MATFLVTRKMSPALATRVGASLAVRSVQSARPRSRLVVVLARVGVLVALVALPSGALSARQRHIEQLANQRHALLERLMRERAALSARERDVPARVEALLAAAARGFDGDWLSDGVRDRTRFASLLTRPLVYVRGPLASFTSHAGFNEAAGTSRKDAFLLCLLRPPGARSERALLNQARSLHDRRMRDELFANSDGVDDALAALPLLSPTFTRLVERANTSEMLDRLERRVRRAPFADAERAAKARLLIYVMDEPGSGIAELDGEQRHAARVGVIDLERDAPLLRLRRELDPSGISTAARVEQARGIDGCALARDVWAAVAGPAVERR